jgi:hypothetical protein
MTAASGMDAPSITGQSKAPRPDSGTTRSRTTAAATPTPTNGSAKRAGMSYECGSTRSLRRRPRASRGGLRTGINRARTRTLARGGQNRTADVDQSDCRRTWQPALTVPRSSPVRVSWRPLLRLRGILYPWLEDQRRPRQLNRVTPCAAATWIDGPRRLVVATPGPIVPANDTQCRYPALRASSARACGGGTDREFQ